LPPTEPSSISLASGLHCADVYETRSKHGLFNNEDVKVKRLRMATIDQNDRYIRKL
jgi:hypothetical protein